MNNANGKIWIAFAALLISGGTFGLKLLDRSAVQAKAMGTLQTKVDFLWSLYAAEALHRAEADGEIERNSPYVITDSLIQHMILARPGGADSLIVDKFLCMLNHQPIPEEDGALAFVIVETLGWDVIIGRSQAFKVSPANYVAIWIVTLREASRIGAENMAERLNIEVELQTHPIEKCPWVKNGKAKK